MVTREIKDQNVRDRVILYLRQAASVTEMHYDDQMQHDKQIRFLILGSGCLILICVGAIPWPPRWFLGPFSMWLSHWNEPVHVGRLWIGTIGAIGGFFFTAFLRHRDFLAWQPIIPN